MLYVLDEAILMSTTTCYYLYKRENHTKLSQMSAAMGFFPKGLQNEFETAVVNEPSVFEPLKFYCIWFCMVSVRLQISRDMIDDSVRDVSTYSVKSYVVSLH